MSEFHDASWFAEQIDMSEDWVRRHMKSLPHHKVGRLRKFSIDSVDEFKRATEYNPYRLSQTPRSQRTTR